RRRDLLILACRAADTNGLLPGRRAGEVNQILNLSAASPGCEARWTLWAVADSVRAIRVATLRGTAAIIAFTGGEPWIESTNLSPSDEAVHRSICGVSVRRGSPDPAGW